MKKRKYVILGVMAAFSLTGCSTPDTSQTLPERLNEIWQSQQSQAETGATQQSQIEEIQTQDAPQEGTIAQPVPPQQEATSQTQTSQQTTAAEFDYDLTQMSSTIVYSQITDMTMVPEEYGEKP